MANTISKENIREGMENLRDAGEQVRGKIRDAADRFGGGEEVQDKIQDIYQSTTDWLQENQGRTIAFAALFVGVGLLGFFIGRSMSGSDLEHY